MFKIISSSKLEMIQSVLANTQSDLQRAREFNMAAVHRNDNLNAQLRTLETEFDTLRAEATKQLKAAHEALQEANTKLANETERANINGQIMANRAAQMHRDLERYDKLNKLYQALKAKKSPAKKKAAKK